jgi:Zinc knuckle
MVMPDKFLSGDFENYLFTFELICELNSWDDGKKAVILGISLAGSALIAYKDIPVETRKNYKELVAALRRKFSPVERVQLEKLKFASRRRLGEENFSEMAHAIRNLAARAYPLLTTEAHEELALDKFIAALPDTIRLLVRQRMPASLAEAVSVAMLQETALETEKSTPIQGTSKSVEICVATPQSRLEEMLQENTSAMRQMAEAITKLTIDKSGGNTGQGQERGRCFNCNGRGHFRADCRKQQRWSGNGRGSM